MKDRLKNQPAQAAGNPDINSSAKEGENRNGNSPAAVPETIRCIRVTPVNEKFADDKLTHRDYLGALMNLGIRRETIDDIICGDNIAYIFCIDTVAQFICNELLTVKHTTVRTEEVPPEACDIEPEIEEVKVNVASERLDVVIAAVYGFSRNMASRLVMAERVSIDGKVVTKESVNLKIGSKVSVRRYGKFVYGGIDGTSKKGRLYVKIGKFV